MSDHEDMEKRCERERREAREKAKKSTFGWVWECPDCTKWIFVPRGPPEPLGLCNRSSPADKEIEDHIQHAHPERYALIQEILENDTSDEFTSRPRGIENSPPVAPPPPEDGNWAEINVDIDFEKTPPEINISAGNEEIEEEFAAYLVKHPFCRERTFPEISVKLPFWERAWFFLKRVWTRLTRKEQE